MWYLDWMRQRNEAKELDDEKNRDTNKPINLDNKKLRSSFLVALLFVASYGQRYAR
jgi:hypothetical protein